MGRPIADRGWLRMKSVEFPLFNQLSRGITKGSQWLMGSELDNMLNRLTTRKYFVFLSDGSAFFGGSAVSPISMYTSENRSIASIMPRDSASRSKMMKGNRSVNRETILEPHST